MNKDKITKKLAKQLFEELNAKSAIGKAKFAAIQYAIMQAFDAGSGFALSNKSSNVDKVKKWLNTYVANEMGFEEDNWFDNFVDYDFSNSNLPYYVFKGGDFGGCYYSESIFMNKDELNELINDQLRSNHNNHWDQVLIFDVLNNKTMEPKFI